MGVCEWQSRQSGKLSNEFGKPAATPAIFSAMFAEAKEESKSRSAKSNRNEWRHLLRKRTENYNLSRDELQRVIDQWIFNERNRVILSDRLFNGTTYERLAEKYGLSTKQVKNIVYKAMDRLEKHL